MLNAIPSNIRAIAISQRGLGGSTPLSPEQESRSVPPRELYDILVNDLHGVLRFMRDDPMTLRGARGGKSPRAPKPLCVLQMSSFAH